MKIQEDGHSIPLIQEILPPGLREAPLARDRIRVRRPPSPPSRREGLRERVAEPPHFERERTNTWIPQPDGSYRPVPMAPGPRRPPIRYYDGPPPTKILSSQRRRSSSLVTGNNSAQ